MRGTSTPPPQADQLAPTLDSSLPHGEGNALVKGKKKPGLNNKDCADQHDLDTRATRRPASPTLLPSPALTVSPSNRGLSPRSSPLLRPIGASPSRRIRSTSPGLHSPASSLIFERNVQEPEPSAHVPAHIKTEDYIPPALDASSLAITDNQLNPDEVEIVMHSAHQPASIVVAGGMADSLYSHSLPHEDTTASNHIDLAEPASDYGSLDMTDPKRLSFISFADVVQAEHVEQDRQEMMGAETLLSPSFSSSANTSTPPLTSPQHPLRSKASPPASGHVSPQGDMEMTCSPGSLSSPDTHSLSMGVEAPLQIETMRQVLRKTHSGELASY